MFKKFALVKLLTLISCFSFGQSIGIGTTLPNASAILDLSSSNKALLLPRLADTNSITTAKTRGLTMFCLADSNVYYYTGKQWKNAGPDNLWAKLNDSAMTTSFKHVGINEDVQDDVFQKVSLNTIGSFRVGQDYQKLSDAQPSTLVMNNTATIQFANDTVTYIYDPGAGGNYINNTQGNIAIFPNVVNEFITISSDTVFELGTGDTLWISTNSTQFSADYIDRFYATKPFKEYLTSNLVYLIFRANGNNNNGSGFKLKAQRFVYNSSSAEKDKANLLNSAVGLRYDAHRNNLLSGSSIVGIDVAESTALGSSRINSGYSSTALGFYNVVNGYSSFAIGETNYLNGQINGALGKSNVINTFGSIAIGNSNDISGSESFAIGKKNSVNASSAIAMGYFNSCDTQSTICIGYGLANPFPGCVVVGSSNKSLFGTYPLSPPSFIVGCGVGKNAILSNGNGFNGFNGIDEPLAAVHANGKVIIDNFAAGNALSALEWRNSGLYRGGFGWDQTAGRFFFYDGESNTNTFFINNGRFGIQRDATTNALEVNGNASKSSPGDWLGNSDARLKKNILPLQGSLDKLLQLKGISYHWADTTTGVDRPKGTQYGFTAQNIQNVFPELVETDAQGYLQTSYGTYDALTVEAIRELKLQIEQLRAELDAIKATKK